MINESSKQPGSARPCLVNFTGIILLALIVTLVFFTSYDEGLVPFLITYAWALAISATQWLGNAYIYNLLDKKYSWREHLVKRAILGSLSLVGYSAFAFLVVQLLMFRVVQGGFPDKPLIWALRSSYIAIAVSFVVSLIFVAAGFFRKWRASLLEAERFRTEMLMYKYEALQNQINPHFLFNSFNDNTIATIAASQLPIDIPAQTPIRP